MTAERSARGWDAVECEHAVLLDTLRNVLERLAARGDIEAFARELRDFVEQLLVHLAGDEHRLLSVGDEAALRQSRERHQLAETAQALLPSLTTRYETFDCWAVALYFLHWLTNHIQR